jgi:hypothetical protein
VSYTCTSRLVQCIACNTFAKSGNAVRPLYRIVPETTPDLFRDARTSNNELRNTIGRYRCTPPNTTGVQPRAQRRGEHTNKHAPQVESVTETTIAQHLPFANTVARSLQVVEVVACAYLLPAPLGPRMARNDPAGTKPVTPSRICFDRSREPPAEHLDVMHDSNDVDSVVQYEMLSNANDIPCCSSAELECAADNPVGLWCNGKLIVVLLLLLLCATALLATVAGNVLLVFAASIPPSRSVPLAYCSKVPYMVHE